MKCVHFFSAVKVWLGSDHRLEQLLGDMPPGRGTCNQMPNKQSVLDSICRIVHINNNSNKSLAWITGDLPDGCFLKFIDSLIFKIAYAGRIERGI